MRAPIDQKRARGVYHYTLRRRRDQRRCAGAAIDRSTRARRARVSRAAAMPVARALRGAPERRGGGANR